MLEILAFGNLTLRTSARYPNCFHQLLLFTLRNSECVFSRFDTLNTTHIRRQGLWRLFTFLISNPMRFSKVCSVSYSTAGKSRVDTRQEWCCAKSEYVQEGQDSFVCLDQGQHEEKVTCDDRKLLVRLVTDLQPASLLLFFFAGLGLWLWQVRGYSCIFGIVYNGISTFSAYLNAVLLRLSCPISIIVCSPWHICSRCATWRGFRSFQNRHRHVCRVDNGRKYDAVCLFWLSSTATATPPLSLMARGILSSRCNQGPEAPSLSAHIPVKTDVRGRQEDRNHNPFRKQV